MTPGMKYLTRYAFFAAVISLFPEAALAGKINASRTGSRIEVTIDNKLFTIYNFPDNEKYPFFFPVNGPLTGTTVTSMRNALYPHHSSLFFGCDLVNGGNYWQEGLDRGRIISVNARVEKEGGDTAVITDECIWSRPGALSPLKDSRRYVITAPSPERFLIDVEITLHALMDVNILKTNHSLFSVRVAHDLAVTNGGTMINAEGASGEKETWGKRSAWLGFHGSRGNGVEGIAIIQHPSNPWYPSPWFTRDYGFMSPTPMEWPENGKETSLKKGTTLLLRYRVVVHSGENAAELIAGEFGKFSSR